MARKPMKEHTVLYERETGKPQTFIHFIDAKESLKSGAYVAENPKKKKVVEEVKREEPKPINKEVKTEEKEPEIKEEVKEEKPVDKPERIIAKKDEPVVVKKDAKKSSRIIKK